jgi:hypothetical protein
VLRVPFFRSVRPNSDITTTPVFFLRGEASWQNPGHVTNQKVP